VKNAYFIAVLLFLSGTGSYAQNVPCFNADTLNYHRRGCAPLTVKMINCSTDPEPKYFYDFVGAPTVYTDDSLHTYTSPGIYTIRQIVDNGNTPGTSPTTKVDYIEVLASPPPDFSVQICRNMLVNVKLNDAAYDIYIIDYGDGDIDTSAGNTIVPHTYAALGSRTITVTGNYLPAYCGATASATITPLSNLVQPDISKLQVTNQADGTGSLTLSFTPVAGQKYFVEQSAGNNSSYTTIDTLPLNPASTVTISNLNTLSTQYCYRITAYDDCGDTLHSTEVCSETITVTALNNQNQVVWSNYPGSAPLHYLLYRNGQLIATLPSNAPYTDNSVRCGTVYCYSVIAELNDMSGGNRIQSISDSSCTRATSTNIPAAIQNLESTISANSVQLSWDKPAAFSVMQYQILRSVNGSSFSNYATSTINGYTDNGADVYGSSYCYMVNYTDSCGLSSISGTSTCPVLLQGAETGSGTVDMTWTTYTGCSNGVQDYTLLFLDPVTNGVNTSLNLGLSNTYTDNSADPNALSLKYQIKATCSGPDTHISFSNIFEINHDLKLFLPDAFTPNNDGVNDVFVPKGKYVLEFKMTIFNRWGEVVFHTDTFTEGWDGNYKGDLASSDAYAYLIEAVDYFGKKVNRKGTVTLLR
jgi:gliding motility-associated-like protein